MSTANNYNPSQYQDAQPLRPGESGHLNGQPDLANLDHSHDFLNSAAPPFGPSIVQSDSGFYDSVLPRPQAVLEPWEKQIWQIWNANTGRDADIATFRTKDVIEAMQQGMDERGNLNTGYLHTIASQSLAPSWQLGPAAMSMPFSPIQSGLGANSATQMAPYCSPPATHGPLSTQWSSLSRNPGYNDNGAYTALCQFGSRPREAAQSLVPPHHTQFTDSSSSGYFEDHPPGYLPYVQPNVQQDGNFPFPTPPLQPPKKLTQKLLKNLVKWVEAFIRHSNSRTCGLRQRTETRHGIYACTLGCGRRFRSIKDLWRHEEIIYPQQFWFCIECGDLTDPSKKHLFTRKDKMEQHLRSHHHKGGRQSVRKVTGVRTTFPERCHICLHHMHATWSSRCQHIIAHCKRDASMQQNLGSSRPARETDLGAGHGGKVDDSDEDRDEDEDEDSDEDNEDDDDSPDASQSPDPGPSNQPPDDDNGPGGAGPSIDGSLNNHSTPHHREGQNRNNDYNTATSRNDTAPFPGYWWKSSTQSAYPSTVSLTSLPLGEPRSFTLPVTWLGRINSKGGTASVYKVELRDDPVTGQSIVNTTYAVKQYAANHQRLFARELEAFTIFSSGSNEQSHIIKCYGTFQYLDPNGNTTYNLLLEYAECDLAEYWATTTPLCETKEELRSWKLMFSMASALRQVHKTRQFGTQKIRGLHMDLKPDNILYADGQWKLSDFGFAKFAPVRRGSMEVRIYVDGGTPRYQAPECACSSLVSQPYDMWAMGCLMFELLLWTQGDYETYRASEGLRGSACGCMQGAEGSGFHDGFGVVTKVQQWFRRLKERITHDDTITGRTLEIVESSLLQVNPIYRINAKQLQYRLAEFLGLRETTQRNVGELSQVVKMMLAYELARSIWYFYESDWMTSNWNTSGVVEESDNPFLAINKLRDVVSMNALPKTVRDAIVVTRNLGYRSMALAEGSIWIGDAVCLASHETCTSHASFLIDDMLSKPSTPGPSKTSLSSSDKQHIAIPTLRSSCIGVLVHCRNDTSKSHISEHFRTAPVSTKKTQNGLERKISSRRGLIKDTVLNALRRNENSASPTAWEIDAKSKRHD